MCCYVSEAVNQTAQGWQEKGRRLRLLRRVITQPNRLALQHPVVKAAMDIQTQSWPSFSAALKTRETFCGAQLFRDSGAGSLSW